MYNISWSLEVHNLKSVEKKNPYDKINSSLRKMLQQENPDRDLIVYIKTITGIQKETNLDSITSIFNIKEKFWVHFKTQNKSAAQI